MSLLGLCLLLVVAAFFPGTEAYRRVLSYNPYHYGHNTSYIPVSPEAIRSAIAYATDFERNVFADDRGLGRNEDHPSYWGNGIAQEGYIQNAKDYANTGHFITEVAKYLTREHGYNPASSYDTGLPLIEYLEYLPSEYGKVCSSYYQKCYVSKYRSMDGSCNNVKHPYYGQSNTILGRIAIPRYADEIHSVRRSVDGSPLPQPRSIRFQALPDKDVVEPNVNMLFVNFGQFITHDLVHTPFYQGEDGLFLDCCYGYRGGYEQVHPKCLAIPIQSDPFYASRTPEQCLNFARAIVAPNYGCTVGYANPINYQTSHLDLSLQYGRTLNQSLELRLGQDGLLRTSKVGYETLLPIDLDAECFKSSSTFCFTSGDLRTTIHPGLTLFQILSTRFHNLLARKLQHLNPEWGDEELFQEARRINIAVNQHIVYNEYLPLLLGDEAVSEYGLLSEHGYSRDYDENAKPWIYAEFSGSAFRLHTSVYGQIYLADEDYDIEEKLPLEDFYNSAILFKEPQNFNRLLRGYIRAPERRHDKYYDPAISDYLLKDERHFGLDIGAFNMQRGRDYGLESYNTYRSICGLRRARTFSDFSDTHDPQTIEDFRRLYRHPDDVDLYTAGIAERHVAGSLLGPTHHCIVSFQFQRLKISDRFFYTHASQYHAFSPSQLSTIRGMTMSRFLCLTTSLTHVPVLPFQTLSPQNPLIACSDYDRIPRLKLRAWKSSGGTWLYAV